MLESGFGCRASFDAQLSVSLGLELLGPRVVVSAACVALCYQVCAHHRCRGPALDGYVIEGDQMCRSIFRSCQTMIKRAGLVSTGTP